MDNGFQDFGYGRGVGTPFRLCTVCVLFAACFHVTLLFASDSEEVDMVTVTLRGSIHLDPPKPLPPFRISDSREILLFGRQVPNEMILVDEETGGLANVFVTAPDQVPTDSAKIRNERAVRTYYVAMANGSYVPHVIVAKAGDKLEFLTFDKVLNAPIVERISNGPLFPNQLNQVEVLLSEHTDRPLRISSSIFPRLSGVVYIQENTVCAITDRLGYFEIKLPHKPTLRISFWHELLGKPTIKGTSKRFSTMDNGVIQIEVEANEIDLGRIVFERTDGHEKRQDKRCR